MVVEIAVASGTVTRYYQCSEYFRWVQCTPAQRNGSLTPRNAMDHGYTLRRQGGNWSLDRCIGTRRGTAPGRYVLWGIVRIIYQKTNISYLKMQMSSGPRNWRVGILYVCSRLKFKTGKVSGRLDEISGCG
jgi:hypothetical protein